MGKDDNPEISAEVHRMWCFTFTDLRTFSLCTSEAQTQLYLIDPVVRKGVCKYSHDEMKETYSGIPGNSGVYKQ
jgi:hypothetical protein